MGKPEPVRPTVVAKPVVRTHVPAKRVVAYRRGNNSYELVVETYDCPPTSAQVLKAGCTADEAMYEVKLWNENFLGPDRYGSSGL